MYFMYICTYTVVSVCCSYVRVQSSVYIRWPEDEDVRRINSAAQARVSEGIKMKTDSLMKNSIGVSGKRLSIEPLQADDYCPGPILARRAPLSCLQRD